jgi:hypothetical protein
MAGRRQRRIQGVLVELVLKKPSLMASKIPIPGPAETLLKEEGFFHGNSVPLAALNNQCE